MEPGRNDPCRCGSGKKYKQCSLGRDGASVVDLAEGIGGEVVVVPDLTIAAAGRGCGRKLPNFRRRLRWNRNATEVGDVSRAILQGHHFRAVSVMQDWTGIGQGEQFTSDVSRDSIG